MENYSELDCDHDICGPCEECGQEVHEAGSTICDNCDPERQADYWHDIDDTIEF